MPLNFFIAVSVIFAWSGEVRLFIREADQLFLWSRLKWIREIMKRGIAYSAGIYFVFCLFYFLLLAPLFIVQYDIPETALAVFFLIIFISKILLGLLKQIIELSFDGFGRQFVLKAVYVLITALFVFIIPFLLANLLAGLIFITTLIIINCCLIKKRLNIPGSFVNDTEREEYERLKHEKFILKFSGASTFKPKKLGTRPFLFKKSNHIFRKRTAVNGLVELGIKSFLRNNRHLFQYLFFIVLCAFTVIKFSVLKWYIWLGLALILTYFVSIFWEASGDLYLAKMYQWKDEDLYCALQKYIFILTLPGFMAVSFVVGFQAFSWIGAFSLLPVGAVFIYYMSKLVSFYIFTKSKNTCS